MFLRHVIQTVPFYAPDDSNTGGGPGNVGPIADDASILEEDDRQMDDEVDDDTSDDKSTDDDDEEEDKESDDEDDKDNDKEDDDEEEDDDNKGNKDGDDEEEEDGTSERLSTYTDIKKKYPTFFKEFPDIKGAIFRDTKYGEMFGSIKEAENAANYSQVYQQMSDDILGKGEIIPLFDQVLKQKPESFEKIAFSILPYLFEKNKDLHFEVVAPTIKNLVRSIVHKNRDSKDPAAVNLYNAAMHLHNHVFGDTNIDSKMKAESFRGKKEEKSEEVTKLEKALSERDARDHNNFLDDVDSRYVRSITKTVESALEKNDEITSWMRSKITGDLIKEVKKQMDSDRKFVTSMNNLINSARKSGYASDFKSRIINAALDRAKPLIPDIRRKLVAEALGKKLRASGDGKEVKVKKEEAFKPRKIMTNGSGKVEPKKASSNPDLDILRS